MLHLLPASTEPRRERQCVGVGTVLLHVLLAWWLLQVAGRGAVGASDGLEGEGDALVVEYIALPMQGDNAGQLPLEALREPIAPERHDPTTRPHAAPDPNDALARSLSEAGEYVPPEAASRSAARSSQPHSPGSAARGGNPADDLFASYQAALRAHIAQTWRSLTDRDFPSGCSLRLSQNAGGAVTATSANGCPLSQEDRLQLEAATLMAQPLPYTGYEAVFAPEMRLDL